MTALAIFFVGVSIWVAANMISDSLDDLTIAVRDQDETPTTIGGIDRTPNKWWQNNR